MSSNLRRSYQYRFRTPIFFWVFTTVVFLWIVGVFGVMGYVAYSAYKLGPEGVGQIVGTTASSFGRGVLDGLNKK
jgi:hypothetical protein